MGREVAKSDWAFPVRLAASLPNTLPHERPCRTSACWRHRVAIRAAIPADARALEAIEAASFAHDRLSPRALARHLRSDNTGVFAAMVDGALAGYVLRFYRRTSTLARLYSIATLPAARGLASAAA